MADLVLRGQVETLYQHAADSQQEFCIDLEGEAPDGQLLWQWAHLSRADNARRSVVGKKQLIEGEHYLLLRSEGQVTSSNGVVQSREKVTIWFSVEGFELWLLMLDTPRGHEIRQFFRECHKRLQLEMSQPTGMNAALGKILDRQQALAEDMSCMVMHGFNRVDSRIDSLDNRLARLEEQQCDQLYVFVRPKDLTIKLGHTIDLDQRRKQHERRGFRFVGAVSGTRKRESQIKESLKNRGFLPKNGTEEFQFCPEIVEAFNHEGLPIGDLSLAKPQTTCGRQHRKKADPMMLTPMLF